MKLEPTPGSRPHEVELFHTLVNVAVESAIPILPCDAIAFGLVVECLGLIPMALDPITLRGRLDAAFKMSGEVGLTPATHREILARAERTEFTRQLYADDSTWHRIADAAACFAKPEIVAPVCGRERQVKRRLPRIVAMAVVDCGDPT